MALLVTPPPPITFSKEPTLWKWEDDRADWNNGINAQNIVAIDSSIFEGAQMVIRWGDQEQRFTATATPGLTGNYIPLYTFNDATREAYVKSLVPILQNNYYLNEDFEIEAISFDILGFEIWNVALTARKTGTLYNCINTKFKGGGVTNYIVGTGDNVLVNYSVFLEIFLGDADSVNFERIYKASIDLDDDARAQMNVSDILHAYLESEIPDFVLPVAQKCQNSRRKYYIRYAPAGGENFDIGTIVETEKFVIILGGGTELNGSPRTVTQTFKNLSTSEDRFLMLQDRTRWIRQDEPVFVSWLNFSPTAKNIHASVLITFSDGTTTTTNTNVVFNVAQYEKLLFAVGFRQLNLTYYAGTKEVSEYTVTLRDDSGVVSEGLRCIVNYAHEEYIRYFAHINSHGALETIKTYGKGSGTWKVFKETAERLLPVDFNAKSAQYIEWNHTFQDTTETATGFVPKYQLKWFLDFFLSPVKYRVVNNLGFAIGVNTDTIERGTDGQNQFGFVFEYQYQRYFEYVSATDLEAQEAGSFIPANVIVAGNVNMGSTGGSAQTVDPYPILGSLNPVASSGVYAMFQLYQEKLAEGSANQLIRGDGSLFDIEKAVNAYEKDLSVPSFAKTLTNLSTLISKLALPDWLKTANNPGQVLASEILNFSIPGGMYPVTGATKDNGFPFEGDGTIMRVVTGDAGARKGAETATSSTGETFTRSLNEADGNSDWKKLAAGEEPTFANIPTFRFPIGQLTSQIINLEPYLVSDNTNLRMTELSKPDFVQSLTVDGLKMTLTAMPTNATEKGVVLEVTDEDTGASRTVSVSVAPRTPVDVKFNLYDATTSSVVAEIPSDGTGVFTNLERIDIQFVVPSELHDGVQAVILGGGADGISVSDRWTQAEFEPLAEPVNGGVYRQWAYISGRAVPDGPFTVQFKLYYQSVLVYSGTRTFTLTPANIPQADLELWDEAVGTGFKVGDINDDGTSVFQPVTNGDIRFVVKNITHNQVFAKVLKDGEQIFQWAPPYENVTETDNGIYQMFGPAGSHLLDEGRYQVFYYAFLDTVQVFEKDLEFDISANATSVPVLRAEFWDETSSTPVKVGDILANNTSSFVAVTKCDIRFNLFNCDHNQVYAELRNASGVAIATWTKPYETVPQAINAIYNMFGSGSGTNIGLGAMTAYYIAKKDGTTVFEKTLGFVLTSADNGIGPIQLKNLSTGVVIGNITNGSSFPLPSIFDLGVVITDRPHDYFSAALDKEINGSYDNSNLWYNQLSNLSPVTGSVTRYVFDEKGNTFYENANRIYREGKYRLVIKIRTGGASGILVSQHTVEFTLTTNTDVPYSGLDFLFQAVGESTFPPYPAIPATGGSFPILKDGDKLFNVLYNFSAITDTYNWVGKKIEIFENGAFVDMDAATLLGYPAFLSITTSTKSYQMLTPRSSATSAQIMWKGKDILRTDNRFRVTFTLRNGGASGTIVDQKIADFSVYLQGNTTLAPFTQTPKKRITIKNVNGVYSDIEPGETVTNGVRYRTENGRTYKVLYWINELPWAGAGDTPKDLGEIAIPNGLLVSIRKVYADVTWVGSNTFASFISHGWDFWMHGGENPNADFGLVLATVMTNFTTNGGTNLDTGNAIRHQNPAWLVANQPVPQFFLNASPYTRSPKAVCIQCVPIVDDVQETINRLANGGVTHIFWQNIHGAGMYDYATGYPKPGLDMKGILPCFNLASQDIFNAVKAATGVSLTQGQQVTRDQARIAADACPLRAGAVYTDEFSEGSYPQFEQQREWYYERVKERVAEMGISVIFAGDYGYGSQNIRIDNPADSTYMKSLLTSNVVANLEVVDGSNHYKYKQYVQYYAQNRDTVMGAYYAITVQPLYRRQNGLPIEAIVSINATNTLSGGRKKVRFCTPIMQSNGNGTDVPQKDSGTIMPNGSINYDYPAAPAEMMRQDGFFNKLFYDASYIWDAWGVRNANDVNNFYGMNMCYDAFIEGGRLYDRIYPYLVEAGMDMYASDYTSNGTAFTSSATERRISRVGTSYFNNDYFNQALDAGKGMAITIRGSKKVFIYLNCDLHVTEKERVVITDNGTQYDIGDVAGNTLCVSFQP